MFRIWNRVSIKSENEESPDIKLKYFTEDQFYIMCKLVAIFEKTISEFEGDPDQILSEKTLDEKIQKCLFYRANFDFSKIQDVSYLSSQYFGSASIIDTANIDNNSIGYS
jgi:hypothetical protein